MLEPKCVSMATSFFWWMLMSMLSTTWRSMQMRQAVFSNPYLAFKAYAVLLSCFKNGCSENLCLFATKSTETCHCLIWKHMVKLVLNQLHVKYIWNNVFCKCHGVCFVPDDSGLQIDFHNILILSLFLERMKKHKWSADTICAIPVNFPMQQIKKLKLNKQNPIVYLIVVMVASFHHSPEIKSN